jgi:hypothetical protein
MGFFDTVGEVLMAPVEQGKKTFKDPSLENLGRTALDIGTLGSASMTIKGVDMIEEGLDGINKQEKPAELTPEYVALSDTQKEKQRAGVEKIAATSAAAYNPDNLRTSAPGVSALGNALVNGVNSNAVDPNSVALANTTVAAPGTREVTQIDRSNLVDVPTFDPNAINTSGIAIDPNNIRRGEAYTGDANSQQKFLLNALQQQSQGEGPSLATGQFQAANEANLAASLAQQASLRGGFDPAAARQIRQTAADLQAQSARDAAQARIQEQMSAREQLAGVASTVEQQNATAGSQSIQTQATDTNTEQAVAATAAAKADLDLQINEAATSLGLQANEQEIKLALSDADLKDTAKTQQYQAETQTKLAQANITSEEAKLKYSTTIDTMVKNMVEKNDAVSQAYAGDSAAIINDINAANRIIEEGAKAGVAMEVLRQSLESQFIADGNNLELAKIKAKNGFESAMVARAQAINDGKAAMTLAVVNAGSKAAGAAVGAMAGPGGAQAGAAMAPQFGAPAPTSAMPAYAPAPAAAPAAAPQVAAATLMTT